MSAGRTAAIVALGILLTLSIGASNVVFAAQGTVLDAEFVTTAIAEEDGHEALTAEMQRSVENATANATGGDLDGSSFSSLLDGDPIQDAVTPEYVQSQVEPNVREFYAYLHGDSDVLNLSLDARPLAEDAGTNVADAIRNSTVTELVEAAPGDPFADVPVDASFVDRLNEGPESYSAAKDDLRDDVRERVVDRMVERTYSQAVAAEEYDRLLALVIPDYDPDEYNEAEKRGMVSDRESEIRTALRAEIEADRSDEIDSEVQAQLDEYRDAASGQEPNPEQVGNEEIATAAGDLQTAVVVGATSDQSYEAYRANVTSARADLGSAIGDYVTELIGEDVGVVDMNEELAIQERGAFEDARTMVGYADLATLVVPLLAVLIVAGVWFVSRSPVATAATVGASLVVGALPAFVGASVAGDQLRSTIDLEGEAATSLQPVVQGLVDRVVAAITGQSLALAVVGLLLVTLALALHYGLLDRFRERTASR